MNARAKARAIRTEAGHETLMHPQDGAKLPGTDSLDGSLTPRGPLDVFDLAGDQIDHTSFRQVAKVSRGGFRHFTSQNGIFTGANKLTDRSL